MFVASSSQCLCNQYNPGKQAVACVHYSIKLSAVANLVPSQSLLKNQLLAPSAASTVPQRAAADFAQTQPKGTI
jgi:hypothetical protein